MDASTVQIILAALAILGTLLTGRQQVLRIREQRAAAQDKANADRRHTETVARLEREKIEADTKAREAKVREDKAVAESRRIANESEGELLKVTAEANQMNQVGQLMISQQMMLTDAFKQISIDSAQNRLVYDRVAENLSKQTEAIAMVTAMVQSGHSELKTELEGMRTVVHQAMRDFPNTVDLKVSPMGGQLRQIQEALVRLTTLVQGAQITALLTTPPPNSSDSQPLETAS